MKAARASAFVAATAIVLAACGSSSSGSGHASAGTSGGTTASSRNYKPIRAGPIVLGVSVPLSGPTAAFGIGTKLGFQVALRSFDAAHPDGIDGHRVEIKILDDGGDVTKAVRVAEDLSADHVAAVVTVTYNPAAADQQLAVFNKNRIPVIATLPGPQYADTSAWPYDFGIGAQQQQQGLVAARYIAAKGYTRVATLTDGIPTDVSAVQQITESMKRLAPHARVVKALTVPPGSVDLSVAVAQLRSANPQLLIAILGFAHGPLWSAMRSARFAPQLMVDPGAWYDGFSAMGPLAKGAVTPYLDCADSAAQMLPPATTALMTMYEAVTGDAGVDYLTYVANDTVPLELARYAIGKYHSTDPDAMKAALESMPRMNFYGLTYRFSATNHVGATAIYGPAVCNMGAPYAGGRAKVPVKAKA